MKKSIILFLSCFFLTGCCLFTSQDCGCEPPDEEFLADEPKEWLSSLVNGEYQIFVDSSGNLDSLEIEISQDTYWNGGEECGADSEVERAVLISINRIGVRFSIEAMFGVNISINQSENLDDFIQLLMDTQTDELIVANENAAAELKNDFVWNGDSISVLKVDCIGTSDCSNFTMANYIFSKDLGLLEFVDANAETWKRIN